MKVHFPPIPNFHLCHFTLVAPEEPYDGRSLYDRLKEQRDAKDLEFEEARKFKNMIRGLDVSFLGC